MVDVLVWLTRGAADDLAAQGLPHPAPIRCRGVLDTGTDISLISPRIRTGLGLVRVAHATSTTASGILRADLYRVSVSITDFNTPGAPLLSMPDLLVMEFAAALPVDVVIGLDVLLTVRLLLDGWGRCFTLDF